MNIYPLLRPLLFSLDAESAHYLTLRLLKLAHQTGLSALSKASVEDKPVQVMGLHFKNRLGLAAGLDKNGEYIDALGDMGFGFVEIGTVTPRAQAGNPLPRVFRLPEHQAIINRMGFNNFGIEYLLNQVKISRYQGILGINIGKNADVANENANQDYLLGLRKSYMHASYVTINISSPNTKNLRQLQQGDEIKNLLHDLKEEQLKLQTEHGKYTPIAVKIAPDLSDEDLVRIARLLVEFNIDGVIATNTTLARDQVQSHKFADENGGLSGAPLTEKATQVVKVLASELNNRLPIIAAGGIMSVTDAQQKIQAGASLIQIYSGLIYKGPAIIAEILRGL
ncbi:quinone-dependent dihydroorotate dehydrogenase [Methylomonas sp. AM2-LC]|uniref:quinone-dependent dihydroorotate dehydrogenase n=1 Tax=Methylomonas sp. AM2-LC TaxID=3153301 RepID=UPI003264ABB1